MIPRLRQNAALWLFVGGLFAQEPVQELQSTTVIAAPLEQSQASALADDEILQKEELMRTLGQSIAETMRHMPGASMRSMGPAPARPVLQGLSGEHVVVLENGQRTGDLSATSPDHAVTVEPAHAQSILILQGARALPYSHSLVGGIVDVIENESNDSILSPFWQTQMGTESSRPSLLLQSQAQWKSFSQWWNAAGSYRNSASTRTPKGIAENTQSTTWSAQLGHQTFYKLWEFQTDAHWYHSSYGIPGGFVGAHPNGVDIDMEKQEFSFDATQRDSNSSQTWKILHTYYHHQEFESNGNVGAEFVSRSDGIRWENQRNRWHQLYDIQYGFEVLARRLDMGGFVFTPPTQQWEFSGWMISAWRPGPRDWELTLGSRASWTSFLPNQSTYTVEQSPNRFFPLISSALTSLIRVAAGHFLEQSLYYTSRTPSIEELYNQGPHLASYTYEVGNPQLPSESGIGGSVAYRYRKLDWSANMQIQGTYFRHFLIPRATGDTNWAQLLPIYQTDAPSAWLQNAQAQWRYSPPHGWGFSLSTHWTEGYLLAGGYLPQIPPATWNSELSWQGKNWRFGYGTEAALSQNHVDTYEEKTAGYLVHQLSLQWKFAFLHSQSTLTTTCSNLLNTTYEQHLSRIKSILPEPGRNCKLQLQSLF